jgi:hypothetical protein
MEVSYKKKKRGENIYGGEEGTDKEVETKIGMENSMK